jgi:hypothetical protein
MELYLHSPIRREPRCRSRYNDWVRLNVRAVGVRVPVGQDFSHRHVVSTGSEAHPTSYPIGTGGFFLGGKAAGV